MAEISARCRPVGDGWACDVTVAEGGSETRHSVTVGRHDLDRLAAGDGDPEALVGRSFEFLLAREPKETILRSFALPAIGRYFPEYESEMRRERG